MADAPISPEPQPPIFQTLDRYERSPYSRGEYVRRFLWAAIQQTLFRFSPRRAFAWRAMLLRLFGAKIGRKTRISNRCSVMHPWIFALGEWSSIGDEVTIYNLGPVTVGIHSALSQGTYVCAGTHDYKRPELPLLRTPITIGSGVWIAAQAFIAPGVIVGDNAVVAARAVVTKDVPPGTVVGGNPARFLRNRVETGSPPAASAGDVS